MKRRVFFSFKYEDSWKVSQIRNIGKIDNTSYFCDNDWEEVKKQSDENIKKWIDEQLNNRSCLIVLIGDNTYDSKWVKYEINKAYELRKGILGIYIHNLKNQESVISSKGKNPFDNLYDKNQKPLSQTIKCFDPNSSNAYNDICDNIEILIEDAIKMMENID